jgi:hypothetical protein
LVAHTADIHSAKWMDVEADLFEQGFDRLAPLPNTIHVYGSYIRLPGVFQLLADWTRMVEDGKGM